MIRLALATLLTATAPEAAPAKPLTIKLGTLTPEGSPWNQMLLKIAQDFAKISNGGIKFNIYPGGVLGDEPDLVKKLRIGQLQAVAVSTAGTALLDDGLLALHLPLLFDSYDELDYVRDRMAPKLEANLEKRGVVLLAWSDGGWVQFFSKKPVATMDEIRKLKLFVWAGDADSTRLYTLAKFRPVPLAVTDMLPGLQTGLIEVYDTVPLASLINQWFALAPHMIDLKWAPLMGAVLVSQKTWAQVPAGQQAKLKAAARAASRAMRGEIRRLGDEAVPAMVKRGLNVVRLTEEQRADWQAQSEAFWPRLRGEMGPPEYYDEVMKLRAEYRARKKTGA